MNVPAATSAADYSTASIGWPGVSFYNRFAVAIGEHEFAGRDRDEHRTCLMIAGLLPIEMNGGELCRLVLNALSFLSVPL